MSNQQPTPEQLAEKLVMEVFMGYWKPDGTEAMKAIILESVRGHIIKAIQTATEAKDREIERLNAREEGAKIAYQNLIDEKSDLSNLLNQSAKNLESAHDTCRNQYLKIQELESQNALLVEALGFYAPEDKYQYEQSAAPFEILPEIVYCEDCGQKAREALSNTTQAAQERDARLREAVIEEAVKAIHETECKWEPEQRPCCALLQAAADNVKKLKQKEEENKKPAGD